MKIPLVKRLMRFVTADPRTTCWCWTGHLDPGGYGVFWVAGRHCGAHRVAYELFRGSIPEGLEIDHLCRVRHCVSPWHLELVTHAENVRRRRPAAVKAPPRPAAKLPAAKPTVRKHIAQKVICTTR